MTIREIIEDFESFETWQDRYGYLIDIGRRLPVMEAALKTEDHRVRGCVSNAWLVIRKTGKEKPVYLLEADSDSAIVRGLIALLMELYSGKTLEEIRSVDLPGIFKRLGLDRHLSVSRQNGFFSMVERIKALTAENG